MIASAADNFIAEINESILSLNPLPKTKEPTQQAEEEKDKAGDGKAAPATKASSRGHVESGPAEPPH